MDIQINKAIQICAIANKIYLHVISYRLNAAMQMFALCSPYRLV